MDRTPVTPGSDIEHLKNTVEKLKNSWLCRTGDKLSKVFYHWINPGLSHLLHRSETKTKCHTRYTMQRSKDINQKIGMCPFFFNYFRGLPWNELENHSQWMIKKSSEFTILHRFLFSSSNVWQGVCQRKRPLSELPQGTTGHPLPPWQRAWRLTN